MRRGSSNVILKTIFAEKKISRKDLAVKTGLTTGAVSKIVAELLDSGLICEIGLDKGSKRLGGPTPVFLGINEDKYDVLTIHIGTTTMVIGISNLNANILSVKHLSLTKIKDLSDLLTLIKQTFMEQKKKCRLSDQQILAVGLSIGGNVDKEGIVHYDEIAFLNNIDLKSALEDILGLPVYQENVIRALAHGEYWFGKARECDNFALVYTGGIAAALICLKGRIIEGLHGAAGFLPYDYALAHDNFMNKLVMLKKAREYHAQETESILQTICPSVADLTEAHIRQAAAEGDKYCIEMLQQYGRQVGEMLAMIINLIDPEKIILYNTEEISEIEKSVMFAALEPLCFNASARPEIYIENARADDFLIGTASLAIQKIFD